MIERVLERGFVQSLIKAKTTTLPALFEKLKDEHELVALAGAQDRRRD